MIDKNALPNLENLPTNPADAQNYPELFKAWKELQDRLEASPGLSPGEFHAWDARVKAMLRPEERVQLERSISSMDPPHPDEVQYARANRLTKILWARQGIKAED